MSIYLLSVKDRISNAFSSAGNFVGNLAGRVVEYIQQNKLRGFASLAVVNTALLPIVYHVSKAVSNATDKCFKCDANAPSATTNWEKLKQPIFWKNRAIDAVNAATLFGANYGLNRLAQLQLSPAVLAAIATVEAIGLRVFSHYNSKTSTQPTQPESKPTQPTQPEQPEQPAQPTQPTQPEQPAQPTQPTQPEQPAQPTQPTQPEQPAQPTQPTQPEQPAQPTQPTQPEQPTQPTQPEQPAQPTQPTQPEQPAQPTQSDEKIAEEEAHKAYLTQLTNANDETTRKALNTLNQQAGAPQQGELAGT